MDHVDPYISGYKYSRGGSWTPLKRGHVLDTREDPVVEMDRFALSVYAESVRTRLVFTFDLGPTSAEGGRSTRRGGGQRSDVRRGTFQIP